MSLVNDSGSVTKQAVNVSGQTRSLKGPEVNDYLSNLPPWNLYNILILLDCYVLFKLVMCRVFFEHAHYWWLEE